MSKKGIAVAAIVTVLTLSGAGITYHVMFGQGDRRYMLDASDGEASGAKPVLNSGDGFKAMKLVQKFIEACEKGDRETARACFGANQIRCRSLGRTVDLDNLLLTSDKEFASLELGPEYVYDQEVQVHAEHQVPGPRGGQVKETIIFIVKPQKDQFLIMELDTQQEKA